MMKEEQIEEFWAWFQTVSASLASDIENPSLLQELDSRVHAIEPSLSWEVGPGSCEPWQLVISPNLDREMRSTAQKIVSRAPVIRGWEFHSARRPKDWDYKLFMERSTRQETMQLDVSGWSFVLLRYPNGEHELLLKADDLSNLDDEERWQAAAIVLESILGEDILLEKINDFVLVDELEPRFKGQDRPIQELRHAISLA